MPKFQIQSKKKKKTIMNSRSKGPSQVDSTQMSVMSGVSGMVDPGDHTVSGNLDAIKEQEELQVSNELSSSQMVTNNIDSQSQISGFGSANKLQVRGVSKLTKNRTTNLGPQGQEAKGAAKGGAPGPSTGISRYREVRDKTCTRDNWNFFVGDFDYKTDFFLRFQSPWMRLQYQRHLISSSSYSVNILIGCFSLINIMMATENEICIDERCYSRALFQIMIVAVSVCAANNKLQQYLRIDMQNNKLFVNYLLEGRLILINLIPFCLGLRTTFLYGYLHQVQMERQRILEQFSEVAVCHQPYDFSQIQTGHNYSVPFLLTSQISTLQSSFESLIAYSQSDLHRIWLYFLIIIHNLPLLQLNMVVMPDWIDYIKLSMLYNIIYCTVVSFFNTGPQRFEWYDFLVQNLFVLSLFAVIFASNEKIKKEMFVLKYTNSKTKKQLMMMINQITPTVVVQKDGLILMSNDNFESLLKEQLGFRSIPSNLLKFIQNDVHAKNRLQDIIQRVTNKSTGSMQSNQSQKFYFLINKNLIMSSIGGEKKRGNVIKKNTLENQQINDSLYFQNIEENKPKKLCKWDQENYLQKYESFILVVSSVYFKSSKCIMINFERMTNTKAQQRLLGIHTKLISYMVLQSQQRMEQLHRNLTQQGLTELAQQIGQQMGNSQVTQNMLQQLYFHFKKVTNLEDYKIENYVLLDEIDYCLDGISSNKWDKQVEICFTKCELPRKVLGDLNRFRICMMTLLEFGIKYQVNNQIHVRSQFITYTPERHFVIQFSLILSKNPKFSLEPLEILLEDTNENDSYMQEMHLDSQIQKNYQIFFDHIKEFGYGMIMLPYIVRQLKGSYFIQTEQNNDNSATLSQGKLKIGFKLPFEQAGLGSEIQTPYNRINSTRKEIDGKQIYKTPQIVSRGRSVDQNQLIQMRSIMVGQGLSSNGTNNNNGQGRNRSTVVGHAAPSPAVSGNTNSLAVRSNTMQTSHGINSNDYASINNTRGHVGQPSLNIVNQQAFGAQKSQGVGIVEGIRTSAVGYRQGQGQIPTSAGPNQYQSIKTHNTADPNMSITDPNFGNKGAQKYSSVNLQKTSEQQPNGNNHIETFDGQQRDGSAESSKINTVVISAVENTQKNLSHQQIQNSDGGEAMARTNSGNNNVDEFGNANTGLVVNDQSSANGLNSSNALDQTGQSRGGTGSSANSVKKKQGIASALRNNLLGNTKLEGKPKQFFKPKIDSNTDQMSNSTAQFINKCQTSTNNGDKKQPNDCSSGVHSSLKNPESFGFGINSQQRDSQDFKTKPPTYSFVDGSSQQRYGLSSGVECDPEMMYHKRESGHNISSQQSKKGSYSKNSQTKSSSPNKAGKKFNFNLDRVNDGTEGTSKTPESSNKKSKVAHQGLGSHNNNDSEMNDVVQSLNDSHGDIGDLENTFKDYPFNFQMEKIDSFMQDSLQEGDPNNSIGYHNYLERKAKNEKNLDIEREEINQMFQKLTHGQKTTVLSKFINRQIFDNFAVLSCASKNLLSSVTSASQVNESYDQSRNLSKIGDIEYIDENGEQQLQYCSKSVQVQKEQPIQPEEPSTLSIIPSKLQSSTRLVDGVGMSERIVQTTENIEKINQVTKQSSNQLMTLSQALYGPNSNRSNPSKRSNKKSPPQTQQSLSVPLTPAQPVQPPQEVVKNNNIFLRFSLGEKNKDDEPYPSLRCYHAMNYGNKIQLKKDTDVQNKYLTQVNHQKKKMQNRVQRQQETQGKFYHIQWMKNTIMYPPDTNHEFDVMDKNQNLKNMPMIFEEIEIHQQNCSSYQMNLTSVMSPQIQTMSIAGGLSVERVNYQTLAIGGSNTAAASNATGSVHCVHSSNENPSMHDRQAGNQEETSKDALTGKQLMLIVEDNMFIQKAVKAQLDKLGVDYESCMNGQDAIEIVEKYLKEGKMFDIILMDLIMPVMNGYKAATEIRKLEKVYGIPESQKHFICAYSAEVSLGVEKKSFENGMDDIIVKPMNSKTLERMLSVHDRRKMRQTSQACQVSSSNQQMTSSPLINNNPSPISDSRLPNKKVDLLQVKNTSVEPQNSYLTVQQNSGNPLNMQGTQSPIEGQKNQNHNVSFAQSEDMMAMTILPDHLVKQMQEEEEKAKAQQVQ